MIACIISGQLRVTGGHVTLQLDDQMMSFVLIGEDAHAFHHRTIHGVVLVGRDDAGQFAGVHEPAGRFVARAAGWVRTLVPRARGGYAHLRHCLHGFCRAHSVCRLPRVLVGRSCFSDLAGAGGLRSDPGGAGHRDGCGLSGCRCDHEGRAEHQRPHHSSVDLGVISHRSAGGHWLLWRRDPAERVVSVADDVGAQAGDASAVATRHGCHPHIRAGS